MNFCNHRALRTAAAVAALIISAACPLWAAGPDYDPLALSKTDAPQTVDLTVHDEGRQRDIPLRVYLPAVKSLSAVILFSHGLGGSRAGYSYLGNHWAARGYVVVHLQHPGSDDGVWRGKPPAEAMAELRKAANVENFLLRVQDVPAVLDQLTRWTKQEGHALAGRLDLDHVGMAGHSFGAVTAQAVSGESFPLSQRRFTDARIKAALLLSPSVPRSGDPPMAFSGVTIPWMLMTGTADNSPIGDASAESRRAVFDALPAGGDKYELVLDGAEHSAFSDRALPGDQLPRNPQHQRAVLALSTAFWDAYLRTDVKARAWLDGGGARSVLAKSDEWKEK